MQAGVMMRQRKLLQNVEDLPSSFKLIKYQGARDLDAKKWAHNIQLRLSNDHMGSTLPEATLVRLGIGVARLFRAA